MKKKQKRQNESNEKEKSREPKKAKDLGEKAIEDKDFRDESRSSSRTRRSLSSLFRRQSGDKHRQRSDSREQSSREKSTLQDYEDQTMSVRLKPREHLSRLTVREALMESKGRGRSPHRNTVKLEKVVLDGASEDERDIVDGPVGGKGTSASFGTFPRSKKRRVASDTRVQRDTTGSENVLRGTENTTENQHLPLDKRKYIIDPVNRRDGLDSLESLGLFTTVHNESMLKPQSPTHSSHEAFPFLSVNSEQDMKRHNSLLQFLQLRDKKPSRSPQSCSHGMPSDPSTPVADVTNIFPGDSESRQSAFSVVTPSSQSLILQPGSITPSGPKANDSNDTSKKDYAVDKEEGSVFYDSGKCVPRKSTSKSPSRRGSYVSPRRFTRASRSSVTSSTSNATDMDTSQANTPTTAPEEPQHFGRYHRQFSSNSEKRRKQKENARSKQKVKDTDTNLPQDDKVDVAHQHPHQDSITYPQGSHITKESNKDKTPNKIDKMPTCEVSDVKPILIPIMDKPIVRPVPVKESKPDNVVKPLAIKPKDIPNIVQANSSTETGVPDRPLIMNIDEGKDSVAKRKEVNNIEPLDQSGVLNAEISDGNSTGIIPQVNNQGVPRNDGINGNGRHIPENVFEPIRDTNTEPVTLAEIFHESEFKAVDSKAEASAVQRKSSNDHEDIEYKPGSSKKEKRSKSKDSKSKDKHKEKKKKEPKIKEKVKDKTKTKSDKTKRKSIEQMQVAAEIGDTIVKDLNIRPDATHTQTKEDVLLHREASEKNKKDMSKAGLSEKSKKRKQSKGDSKIKETIPPNEIITTETVKEVESAVKIGVLDKDKSKSAHKDESRANKPKRFSLSKSDLNKSKKKMKRDKKNEGKLHKSASGSDIEVKMVRSSSLCHLKDADEATFDKKRLQRSKSVVSKRKHHRIDDDLLVKRTDGAAKGAGSSKGPCHKDGVRDPPKQNTSGTDRPQPKLSLTAIITMRAGLARMRKAKELARAQQAKLERERAGKEQDTCDTQDSTNDVKDESEDARVAKVVYENEVNNSIGKQSDLNETELIDDELISTDKEVKDLVYERRIHFPYNDESISEEDLIKQRQRNTRLTGRRESKVRQRQKRVINCLKKFVAFLFSHIGLCTLVVAYCILGGFIFKGLEGEAELKEKEEMMQLRRKFRDDIYRLSLEKHIMNEKENDEFKKEIERILRNYSENIHARITEGGWDGKDSTDQPEQWSFPSSLLYAITVMTTIGYGHVAPKTDVGRIVTIAYAVLGIPLTLLCLTNIGDVMAHGFRMLYSKFFCGLCCILFRPARRKRLDPEKGMAPGEERMMLQEDDKSTEVKNVPTSVCLLLMTAYIMLGTLLFARWEKWDAVTGTYFCFITLSTIGFGDVVPGISSKNWDNEKLILCAMYLVFGLSLIAMCFNLVQEDVKGKCKWLGMKLGIIDKPVAPQI